MSSFVQTIQNIFRIEELRKRMITTLLILVVVRVGAHITLPGIDIGVLQTTMGSDEGTLFGLFDLFVGGAWSNAAIFALGVMPYITASIILQLGGIVVPELQRLQREGEEGRRKINQWTRMLTVGISALQAYGTTVRHLNTVTTGAPLVPVDPVLFTISTVFLLTAGTVFMMWLGEQITDRGIGNGISLIIFIGIIARLPESVFQEYKLIEVGQRNWIVELIILVILVAIIAGVVLVTQGAR